MLVIILMPVSLLLSVSFLLTILIIFVSFISQTSYITASLHEMMDKRKSLNSPTHHQYYSSLMQIRVTMNFLSILLLFSVMLLLLVFIDSIGEVSGKTWFVDDDDEADFVGIQVAIDSADEGDEIRIAEGNYSESLVIDKTIILTGAGPGATFIDAGLSGIGIEVRANSVIMENFSITHRGLNVGNVGIKLESHQNQVYNVNSSISDIGLFLDSSDWNIVKNCTVSKCLYYVYYWKRAVRITSMETIVPKMTVTQSL